MLVGILAEENNGLSPRIRRLLEDLRAEWRDLDERIEAYDAELVSLAKQDEICRRLCEIPGIGPLNATALVAAVGNAAGFGRGRDLAVNRRAKFARRLTPGTAPRARPASCRWNRGCTWAPRLAPVARRFQARRG